MNKRSPLPASFRLINWISPLLLRLGFRVQFTREVIDEYVDGIIYRHPGKVAWKISRPAMMEISKGERINLTGRGSG